MPKLYENAREMLLAEAKRQVALNGYAKTTVRSVSNACGLGVGTLYNYFPSKDVMIATFILEDWQIYADKMKEASALDPKSGLRCVVDALNEFIRRYRFLFHDRDAAKTFGVAYGSRHRQLIQQLVEVIRPLCDGSSVEDKDYLAEFISESLLTWTLAGKSFVAQYAILQVLFQ